MHSNNIILALIIFSGVNDLLYLLVEPFSKRINSKDPLQIFSLTRFNLLKLTIRVLSSVSELPLLETSLNSRFTMSQQKSYIDLTRSRSEENPCLRPLVDHLAQGRYGAHVSSGDVPKVYCVNFEETPSGMQTPRVAKASLPEIVRDLEPSTSSQPRGITQRIIIVEDIDQRTIETLGKTLNIDPIFFAHYLLTDLQNMEKTPAPPSFAMPPSSFVSRDSIHLHYQQIVDLGKELPAKSKIYKYKTAGNVPRLARCPPALSNIQLGILRSCCSALLKDLGNDSWACKLVSKLWATVKLLSDISQHSGSQSSIARTKLSCVSEPPKLMMFLRLDLG